MIPTRAELIERANGALHSGIPRTIYEVMADFALAEIRRAVADELYHLDSRAPNEPTLDVGDFRDGVEEERSQWRHDIHQRAEALRAEQAEHDKPGAGQETPRRSGDAPERSDPPPALNPTTATHNSSARVTYQAEPMSDADALDKAAEILRTNGLMVSAEHLKSEAAKLRAPKLVLAARRGAGAHRKMQHARHHARDGQGRPLRTPPQGAGGWTVKPERIEELRKYGEVVSGRVMPGVRVDVALLPAELRHLLRCALAWAELGELLRSDAVKSGFATALFVNAPDAPLSNRYAVTTGRAHMSMYEPDLLTAVEAALARAKDGAA